jgi:hypothetical protein
VLFFPGKIFLELPSASTVTKEMEHPARFVTGAECILALEALLALHGNIL